MVHIQDHHVKGSKIANLATQLAKGLDYYQQIAFQLTTDSSKQFDIQLAKGFDYYQYIAFQLITYFNQTL